MTDKIQKFIDSLDTKTRTRLKKRIISLVGDRFAEGKDIKKLHNWGENVFRLRMGKIRIVYQVRGKQVLILAVDYRGNIY
jgi:mRNA-degrading endonuclease RelE of RelBE toxin-antitoxin system